MRPAIALLTLALLGVACTSDKAPTPLPTPTATFEITATLEPSPSRTPTTSPTETPEHASPPYMTPKLRSPDGSLIAYVEFRTYGCRADCFVVFESSGGDEVLRVPFTDPAMERMVGRWAVSRVDAWFDDSSGVVVGGSCECDGRSLLPVVIVTPEGGVIDSGVTALLGSSREHVSPNGRYLLSLQHIESPWGRGVGFAISGSAEVIELLTGQVVSTIPDTGGALVDWEWLDGWNLAYALRSLPDPDNGTCDQYQFEWRRLPVEWQVLTIP